MTYPKELYNGDYYRVVHGPEEQQEFQKKGWVEDMPEDHPYIPHTAAVDGKPDAAPEPTARKRGRPAKTEAKVEEKTEA